MGKRHNQELIKAILDAHFVDKKSYSDIAYFTEMTRCAVAGVINRHRTDRDEAGAQS